jgi:hypothetical protein
MCQSARIVDLLPRRVLRFQRAIEGRIKGLRIVMDNVVDPGNRAAVMRSAEAFGYVNQSRKIHDTLFITQCGGLATCKLEKTS